METPVREMVIVVQCHETVGKVCPGYVCEHAFTTRIGGFARYAPDAELRYLSMSCGGCPGRATMRKLNSVKKKMQKKESRLPETVIVHLSSCITRDNHHGPRCPHIDYIKHQIKLAGFDYVEDSYISKKAEERRAAGMYCSYDPGE